MQEVKEKKRETVYLAGKITGDPFYRSKFYEAARELEGAGLTVVNPATLPTDAFEWEAYMRMSSAMLDECAAVCFLPDWTDSRGAMYEFGRATAKKKRIFHFEEWKEAQINALPEYLITEEKLEKNVFRCVSCGSDNEFPAGKGEGRLCWACGKPLVKIHAK